jgi:hypothetical protein
MMRRESQLARAREVLEEVLVQAGSMQPKPRELLRQTRALLLRCKRFSGTDVPWHELADLVSQVERQKGALRELVAVQQVRNPVLQALRQAAMSNERADVSPAMFAGDQESLAQQPPVPPGILAALAAYLRIVSLHSRASLWMYVLQQLAALDNGTLSTTAMAELRQAVEALDVDALLAALPGGTEPASTEQLLTLAAQELTNERREFLLGAQRSVPNDHAHVALACRRLADLLAQQPSLGSLLPLRSALHHVRQSIVGEACDEYLHSSAQPFAHPLQLMPLDLMACFFPAARGLAETVEGRQGLGVSAPAVPMDGYGPAHQKPDSPPLLPCPVNGGTTVAEACDSIVQRLPSTVHQLALSVSWLSLAANAATLHNAEQMLLDIHTSLPAEDQQQLRDAATAEVETRAHADPLQRQLAKQESNVDSLSMAHGGQSRDPAQMNWQAALGRSLGAVQTLVTRLSLESREAEAAARRAEQRHAELKKQLSQWGAESSRKKRAAVSRAVAGTQALCQSAYRTIMQLIAPWVPVNTGESGTNDFKAGIPQT